MTESWTGVPIVLPAMVTLLPPPPPLVWSSVDMYCDRSGPAVGGGGTTRNSLSILLLTSALRPLSLELCGWFVFSVAMVAVLRMLMLLLAGGMWLLLLAIVSSFNLPCKRIASCTLFSCEVLVLSRALLAAVP